MEAWYLWRLSSASAGARRSAVEALGALHSPQASSDLFTLSLRDPDQAVRDAALEALVIVGAGALPVLAAQLGTESVWLTADVGSLSADSARLQDLYRVEKALHISLRVHAVDGTNDFLRNVRLPNSTEYFDVIGRKKSLVWRSGVVTLDGIQCRVFVFDRIWLKRWPGSQPQTICVADTNGKLETWKEVGGEPMYASSAMEERDGKVILRITCRERHHLGPGIYSYGISHAGIELLGADYPGS
jgi:hypothetical protein